MRSREIRVLRPTVDEQTKRELCEVLDNGWLGQGPKTAEFEKRLAEKVGMRHAIGTNSGTSALDLCLRVYDKEYGFKGGELITTPITFVSDAIIAFWHDMDLTFADVDERSLCLDPYTVKIMPNTKAIVVVNSHGRLADMERMRRFIDESGQKILLIEDNAHAMYTPGTCKYSDIQIWSFQAVKTLPAGDGGAVTTNDDRIASELRKMTWLGVERSTFARAGDK
jgi:dTDP-4-amino-4,6-dideoxygalactose transaminase